MVITAASTQFTGLSVAEKPLHAAHYVEMQLFYTLFPPMHKTDSSVSLLNCLSTILRVFFVH